MDNQLEFAGFEEADDRAVNFADVFALPDNAIHHMELRGPLAVPVQIAPGNGELAALGGLLENPQQIAPVVHERQFQELLVPADGVHNRRGVLVAPGHAPEQRVGAAVAGQELAPEVPPVIERNQAAEVAEINQPPIAVPVPRAIDQQERAARAPGTRLRSLLRTTRVGQSLLLHNNLPEQSRNCLATIVAEHWINSSDNRPSQNEFRFWASEIVALFHFETASTWYTPYQGGENRRLAGGRLYNRYNALRRRVAAVLDLTRRNRVMVQPELSEFDYDLLDQLHNVSLDDFRRIKELWSLTFTIRNRKASIEDYYQNFPQLRTPVAPELFQIDYERLHLPNSDALVEKWPVLSGQLLEVARGRPACRTILRNIEHVADAVKALVVLPYLFKPRQLPGTGGWRPSAHEQAKGFFQRVNAMHEMDAGLAAYETLMREHNLTCQPIVMVVGSLENINSSYLIVNREKYAFDDLLSAIDACFKSYFALDARYPRECEHTWIFLEEFVYEVPKPRTSRRNFVSVSTLISDLSALNAIVEP